MAKTSTPQTIRSSGIAAATITKTAIKKPPITMTAFGIILRNSGSAQRDPPLQKLIANSSIKIEAIAKAVANQVDHDMPYHHCQQRRGAGALENSAAPPQRHRDCTEHRRRQERAEAEDEPSR